MNSSVATSAVAAPAPRAILTPSLDFWILGGASIPLFCLFALLQNSTLGQPLPEPWLSRSIAALTTLGLFINTPHFYASYRLAYSHGWGFIARNPLQLIWVPVALVTLMGLSAIYFAYPVADGIALMNFVPIADFLGFGEYARAHTGLGHLIFSFLFSFQFISVAWHYSKQAYGISVIEAKCTDYPVTPEQTRLVRLALYALAFCYICEANAGPRTYGFAGFQYRNFGWPGALPAFAYSVLAMAWAAVLAGVVAPVWRAHGKLPPARVWAPFVTAHLWFVPLIYLNAGSVWFTFFVPFFHGLQYLPFVFRVDAAGAPKGQVNQVGRVALLYALTVAAGYALSHWLPPFLDRKAEGIFLGAPTFFVMSAYLFLNIHHYFIDNAIWRGSNAEIRSRLFAR